MGTDLEARAMRQLDMILPLDELVRCSIETLRMYEPVQGYQLCFSGGKDSVVLKHLADRAGVGYSAVYNMTTIDPPELTRFIARRHTDVTWSRPKHGGFFARAVKKGFPTRRYRWCCAEYKESPLQKGSRALMGIRAAESPRRAKAWQTLTRHRRTGDYVVSPMLHWSDDDLWDYIECEGVGVCELYYQGFHRLGCIGCPMAGEQGRRREFARWPKYEKAWKRLFQHVWDRRTGTMQRDGRVWFGDAYFSGWREMWRWWLCDQSLPSHDECQGVLEFWG